MPNQRAPDQKFTAIWMSEDFLDYLDEGCVKVDKNRSQFIRQAVKEKLANIGIYVDDQVASAPIRAGKKQGPVNYKKKGK